MRTLNISDHKTNSKENVYRHCDCMFIITVFFLLKDLHNANNMYDVIQSKRFFKAPTQIFINDAIRNIIFDRNLLARLSHICIGKKSFS